MLASEVIEELARQVREFGDGPVVQVDEMEPSWKWPVSDVKFDAENQAYELATDR